MCIIYKMKKKQRVVFVTDHVLSTVFTLVASHARHICIKLYANKRAKLSLPALTENYSSLFAFCEWSVKCHNIIHCQIVHLIFIIPTLSMQNLDS